MHFYLLIAVFLGLSTVQAFDSASIFNEQEIYRLLQWPQKRDGLYLKWGRPELGAPAKITFAFVTGPYDAGTDIGSCRELEALDSPEFRTEVEKGFRMWERVAGVRFVRVQNPDSADVVVGMSRKETSFHAYVGLQEGSHKKNNFSLLKRGALCIDAKEPWTFKDRHEKNDDEIVGLSLKLVAAHEAGHILGLDHPGNRGLLMHFSIQPAVVSIQEGDAQAAQALYGPAR